MVYTSGTKILPDEMGPAYWFIFKRSRLLVNASGTQSTIPLIEEIRQIRPLLSEIQYLGLVDGQESYLAELNAEADEKIPALSGFAPTELRMLFGSLEDDLYWLANRALHLLDWRKKNRYCGVCGSGLVLSEEEVAFRCVSCGNTIYPRISPAVIVAITRDDQILLARSARFAKGMYSVIAGFVEAGETLEECVAREIGEEVGIKVKNIRYFCSQPWPYPDSLMLAFTAEYENGEIRIDNEEITDAGWFTADNLPGLPLKASVARRLIDNWLEGVSLKSSRL